MKRVMTIAGSDSGGGAGIQADLKTFIANGVYGMSVVTALTAQNTVKVEQVHSVPAQFVRAQFVADVEDIGVDAVKIGMLADADIVIEVAQLLKEYKPPIVVIDPVMIATSGSSLFNSKAIDVFKEQLLPLATVLTPNVPEASALLRGREIRDVQDAKEAAKELQALGPRAVLLKGGHLPGQDTAVDILCDGGRIDAFVRPWIHTECTHGTGCTLASALTAQLALGNNLHDAVSNAKAFVYEAMLHAEPLGRGHGPLNHGYRLDTSQPKPAASS